jgi:hypothetical protein
VYSALGGDVDALLQRQQSHQPDGAARTPHLSRTSARSPYTGGAHAIDLRGGSEMGFGDYVSYARDFSLPPVALHADSPVTEELSLKDRRRWGYLNGIEPRRASQPASVGSASRKKTGSGRSSSAAKEVSRASTAAYMAYHRYAGDATSLHHPAYLILLERCARYLYVNPQLLHELVCQLELQIVNLAFTGDSTGRAAVVAKHGQKGKGKLNRSTAPEKIVTIGGTEVVDATRVTLGDIRSTGRNRSAHLREVDEYRDECDRALPKLRREGLVALAEKAQLRRRGHRTVGKEKEIEDAASSNGEGAEGSADDEELSQMAHATGTKGVPGFRFSKAGEFWDIEEAFGTAAEARYYAEERKRSQNHRRPRRVKREKTSDPAETGGKNAPEKGDERDGDTEDQRATSASGRETHDDSDSILGGSDSSDALSDWEPAPHDPHVRAGARLLKEAAAKAQPTKRSIAEVLFAGAEVDDGFGHAEQSRSPLPIPVPTTAVKPISLRELMFTQPSPAAPASSAAGTAPGSLRSMLQQAIPRPPGQAGDFSSSSDDEMARQRAKKQKTSDSTGTAAAAAAAARPVVAQKRPRPAANSGR